MTKKKDKYSDYLSEDDVFWLREHIESLIGYTYPLKTLKRRLNALTNNELERVFKKILKANDIYHEIDYIISVRAEKNKDRWP